MTWWNIIKSRGISSGGGKKPPPRKPSKKKGGRTIQGGTYEAAMNNLSLEYSKGKMTVNQYVREKKKIQKKFGKD
jgi:hypothetical protein|tara:strand:- start:993 stop:1217 length:225 start_codon:yes stop_codon:yes gene_type:complete